jgi:hypothetical protein
MKPIDFPEQNIVFAETQPEYQRLPALVTTDSIVISCWKMTWRERLIALLTGKIWCYQMTFGQKLQPQKLTVEAIKRNGDDVEIPNE